MKLGLILVAALLVIGTAIIPSGAAQGQAEVRIVVTFEHPKMYVNRESGKHNMIATVTMFMSNFTCYQADQAAVTLHPQYDGQHYGASFEPAEVKIPIPVGEPGLNSVNKKFTKDTTLNVVWDLESIPKKNAHVYYNTSVTKSGLGSGSCAPAVQFKPMVPAPLYAYTDDAPDPKNATTSANCQIERYLPECQTSVAAPPADSPGLDVVVFMVALLGLVWARRRAKKLG